MIGPYSDMLFVLCGLNHQKYIGNRTLKAGSLSLAGGNYILVQWEQCAKYVWEKCVGIVYVLIYKLVYLYNYVCT